MYLQCGAKSFALHKHKTLVVIVYIEKYITECNRSLSVTSPTDKLGAVTLKTRSDGTLEPVVYYFLFLMI